ncbi:hypothetical protein PgNI_10604 [Pyricularia grisea]|uniref:Uncharacterized protein n=1 Tax=Pyricularia grisea TaxID=148305 RepID=A0A6P8AYG4_PYRGI|nr:hypothetical protein PgNI_10604 [Pyricularia grisea]TLD07375.1 hypothetical protein PgNI_10604 [Pyricularia grisea]
MARRLQTQRSQTEARASRRKDKTPSVGTLGLAYLSTFSLQDTAGLQAGSWKVPTLDRDLDVVPLSSKPATTSFMIIDQVLFSVDGLNGSEQGLNLSESKGMQGGRGTGHNTHSRFVLGFKKPTPCIGGVH